MMNRLDDLALLVGRLLMASLFLPAGINKAMDLSKMAGMLAGKGLPVPDLLAALAASAEIGGSILLILGVVPRLTAILVGGFTLVATLTSHNFWAMPDAASAAAQQTQFFKNMAIIAGTMFYFAAGPGAFALLRRR